jgi:hypothetical protein
LLYAGTVIVGGWVTPGYSHWRDAISELTAEGSSQRLALSIAFIVYDCLVVAFALGLPGALPEAGRSEIRLGALILAVVGLAGIGMSSVFPAGAADATIGPLGWIHILLAAVASLGSMAAVLTIALSLRRSPPWQGLCRMSYGLLGVILVSGALAAIAASGESPLMGLAERVTIGTFLLWVFLLGLGTIAIGRAP